MRLRKIESGLYETLDGQYRVDRVDSLGEVWSAKHGQYVDSTTSVWTVTTRPKREENVAENHMWEEVAEFDTKRECVEYLKRLP